MVAGSNTITNKNIANGAITEDKLANDLKEQIQNTRNQVVNVCNANNLGKHNKNGRTCIDIPVTNDPHCIKTGKDGVIRTDNMLGRDKCQN